MNITIKLGSEQMSLVQLFIPREVAHDTIAELGELGDVQFKDVSTHHCVHFLYITHEVH